jgi:hypothetical protein
MVHFHGFPLELKWMFLDSLGHHDYRGSSRGSFHDERTLERSYAIFALRLTDKRNAHDYAPAQGRLRPAQITLDSYGLQQLQWLARTSIAPHIKNLELVERVVLPHVAVYNALGDQSLLLKKIQKRVKQISAKRGDALLSLVKNTRQARPILEYRPWDQCKDEWQSTEKELTSRYLGMRPISDYEIRTLLDDEGGERTLDLIRSTFQAFPGIWNISTWQMFAAKRVWLHASGSETDIPMLYHWLDAECLHSQSWKKSPRAPFSAHVFQLL